MGMKLSSLFENAPNIVIKELMTDSRAKISGGLFFCVKGMLNDGHKFIQQAKDNGAIAVVHSDSIKEYDPDLTYIQVENVLSALNIVAARFYENCTTKMSVFGVTGTNGKTTITNLIRNVINDEVPCGYIGTIGIYYGNVKEEALLTTPDIVPLHKTLHNMYKAKMKAVSIEVSSIGLELHRCDTIDFNYAIFTNFTHDHLDFHGTMENYFKSKKMLFDNLSEDAVAVINVDDEIGSKLIEDCDAKVITYGIDNDADYRAKNLVIAPNGSSFTLIHKNEEYLVKTNLVAKFNIYNLLATIATVHDYGLELETIISKAVNLPQILGRMERIDEGQNFTIIVDFAHTPDGVEKIYQYAREITAKDKRLITVFGSAGRRDVKKRPIFGELSDKYCDLIILTEDDPREEDPKDIANEIMKGIIDTPCIFIENRYDAIRQAVEVANDGDTVVLMGKGDEQFIYYEHGKHPWLGDHIVAKEVIRKFHFGEGDERNEEE